MQIRFKVGLIASLGLLIGSFIPAQAQSVLIDKNVSQSFKSPHEHHKFISLIVFFQNHRSITRFLKDMHLNPKLSIEPLTFMPAVILTFPKDEKILSKVTQYPSVTYIALNKPAAEKIEVSPGTKKPEAQFRYPGIDKWWANNYKGQSGVIGIIDSGIDPNHQAFFTKKIIVNKSKNSGFYSYADGIRSPHGTGVACIYAGYPLEEDEHIRGVSYKAPIILSGLAGEGERVEENFWLTYTNLNWFFSLNPLKPSVINYSFGNGDVSCSSCPDWSGMAKVVDYIVNKYKILWVTSAGNNGFIKQSKTAPFASTLTIPADNYNALTVANMNMYVTEKNNVIRRWHRDKHAIRYTSSRGPTLLGRKKPDITAPGNDTYTCAPDPQKYHFNYPEQMSYEQGYRLMGGTSAAAPHVGGAIVLIQEAGIKDPMAIKALLINSADSWTDSNMPGPDDPNYAYLGGHHPIEGSQWNPTYGWGYLNMEQAFNQRMHIILNKLTPKQPVIEFKMTLKPQDKVTLVHERRVGFTKQGRPWRLSQLKLELLDPNTKELLAMDKSARDTIHQVSLCSQHRLSFCTHNSFRQVIVRVTLLSSIEGARQENFALAYS